MCEYVLMYLNKCFGVRLVCMFKNWKLLFKNICENTCGWKSVLKCIKYCLKTENGCLKTQIKHPLDCLNFVGLIILVPNFKVSLSGFYFWVGKVVLFF